MNFKILMSLNFFTFLWSEKLKTKTGTICFQRIFLKYGNMWQEADDAFLQKLSRSVLESFPSRLQGF